MLKSVLTLCCKMMYLLWVGWGRSKRVGCVPIHMPIDLVCSKEEPQALPMMLELLLQLPWCHDKGRREGGGGGMWRRNGGGTMAHEGKVSQYYVFFPRWQRQMKPCFCLQTSKILTASRSQKRLCCGREAIRKTHWIYSHYLSHLDVCNGDDVYFIEPSHGMSF